MKKSTLKLNKYIKYISLNKFLMCYFGVDINQIYNSDLTHEDAKKIIPSLKPTTYNNISRDSFKRNMILVKDFNGDILPYQTPKLNEEIEVKNDVKETIVEKDKKDIKNEIIRELKLYELTTLKKKCKTCRDYREIQKLIDSKKDKKSKQYKLKKERLRRDDCYEEY